MVDEWYREMDSQRLCGAVLLDFSAAFDVIDHSLLIEKLELYGFKQASLTLMRSYLSNISQCVYFNGGFSERVSVNCGIQRIHESSQMTCLWY